MDGLPSPVRTRKTSLGTRSERRAEERPTKPEAEGARPPSGGADGFALVIALHGQHQNRVKQDARRRGQRSSDWYPPSSGPRRTADHPHRTRTATAIWGRSTTTPRRRKPGGGCEPSGSQQINSQPLERGLRRPRYDTLLKLASVFTSEARKRDLADEWCRVIGPALARPSEPWFLRPSAHARRGKKVPALPEASR